MAITYKVTVHYNGTKEWRLNGQLHREDGPAIVFPDGTEYWYRHGEPHRDDGPAAEYTDGHKEWYVNGKCHREDGPAVEYADGERHWYLNGVEYTEAEFLAKTSPVKEMTMADVEALAGCRVKIVKE